MWDTNIFLAEGIGMLAFSFALSFILYFNKTKTIKVNPYGEIIITSMMITIALLIGIAATLGLEGIMNFKQGDKTGFDNPAAALIQAFGKQDYSIILPAISGQIVGVIIGFLTGSILVGIATNDFKTAIQISKLEKEKISWRKSIFAEMLGGVILFSAIVFEVFSKNPIGMLVVGLSLFLSLIVGGDRYSLMWNSALGIGMVFIGSFINFSKSAFTNFLMKLSVNIALPIAIGSVLFVIV